jgi:hypothetical protein
MTTPAARTVKPGGVVDRLEAGGDADRTGSTAPWSAAHAAR